MIDTAEKGMVEEYGSIVANSVNLANRTLTEFGLETIDSSKIEVLSPEMYFQRVTSTAQDYASESVGTQTEQLAHGSAGIVLPHAETILYTFDGIDAYCRNPSDPERIFLAAAFAHEWQHLQAITHRQEVEHPETVPIYGSDYEEIYKRHYEDVTFTLVGSGLEVRSRGKIVALQVRLGEFLADVQRHLIIGRSFDLNDIIANIVDYHGNWSKKHNRINPFPLVSDFEATEFSHLCAALCVARMDKGDIARDLESSFKSPLIFLRNNSFGSVLTGHFANGDDKLNVLLDIFHKYQGGQEIDDDNIDAMGRMVYEPNFKELVTKRR
jgi:hypothetical protein